MKARTSGGIDFPGNGLVVLEPGEFEHLMEGENSLVHMPGGFPCAKRAEEVEKEEMDCELA